MFKSARLKLTAWYVVVISLIVVLFSTTIFALVDTELNRMTRAQRSRVERFQDIAQPELPPPRLIMLDDSGIAELRQRLAFLLVTLDLVIIVLSGYFGYLLAGKTLLPIEEMLATQERFVADASHELRTPLTGLRTAMEVALREKKLTHDEAKEIIEDNLKQTKRLQKLAESLLELSRAKNIVGDEQVDVVAGVANAYAQVEAMARRKNIRVVLPKTCAKQAIANSYAVERILVIILDNAIKYSGSQTKIVVAISTAERGKLAISVKDQGIGIAKEQLPRVFDRFYRGEASRSQSTVGYGLGLAIARELALAQRGKIAIVSEPAFGSEVTVTLPASA